MSTRLALFGLALLAVAMAAAAFVVTDVLYDTTWAAVVAAGVVGLLTSLWFVLRLRKR